MGLDQGRWWTPDTARQWQRIFNEVLAEGVGAFMLIWQTVFTDSPSPLLVGAALLALGTPVTRRIDGKLQERDET